LQFYLRRVQRLKPRILPRLSSDGWLLGGTKTRWGYDRGSNPLERHWNDVRERCPRRLLSEHRSPRQRRRVQRFATAVIILGARPRSALRERPTSVISPMKEGRAEPRRWTPSKVCGGFSSAEGANSGGCPPHDAGMCPSYMPSACKSFAARTRVD